MAERSSSSLSLLRRARLLLLYGGFSLLSLLFQTSVTYALGISSFRPDFILILAVHLGLKEHSLGGAIGAFLIGYLLDAFSGAPVGTNALATSLVFLLAYLASRRLWTDSIASATVMVFAASLLKSVIIVAVFSWSQGSNVGAGIIRPAAFDWLTAALLAPFVFAFLDWAKKRMGLGQ